ncbi:hypothetical protein RN001_011157 [Aquatica leii]|uniref:N-acyl-aliphatic-L-amino acid amidohydrolase n=1 Tax=Aquatica leii TaxID=1421715 RepID=A0AAN7PAR1_9COLE|nr:hypothetical protein RN001_011157 [Aquatica leii]
MGYFKGWIYFILWYSSILAGYAGLFCPLFPVLLVSNKLYRYLTDVLFTFWQSYPTVLLEVLCGCDVQILGDPVMANETSLLIMNHRTRTDWNFLWPAVYHCTRGSIKYKYPTKFVLKDIIKHIPGIGWIMQLACFLYIKRNWVYDRKKIDRYINYFCEICYKYSLLIFPEGTDFTETTKENSFVYLAQKLLEKNMLDALYDLTLVYPDTIPQTEKILFNDGKFPQQVKMHFTRYPASVLPKTSDELKAFLEKRCQNMSEKKILEKLSELDRKAVDKFREYLRIPSVHPDVDYEPCVAFLKRYGEDLELPVNVYYVHEKKPTVVFTWAGKELNSKSILLNGHMDVVPVFENKWTHKPFDADIDEHGDIYARGAQDMKSNSVQYLEAIRRLKKDGVVPKRTVYVTFAPDEEIGVLGFREFVKTEDFRKMNVGFCVDEGDPCPRNSYIVYYGEKSCWEFTVHCPGQPGHGSHMPTNTAGEKARVIVDKFSDLRRAELRKLEENANLNVWDVTSVNLTRMRGGVQSNVIPEEFCLTYDVRISPTTNPKKFESMIEDWCKEAGAGVWIEYEEKEEQRPMTRLENNPYWDAMRRVAKDLDVTLEPQVMLGATDSRFVREINIPVLSFSLIRNTPYLPHDHDERVSVDAFLDGIRFMHKLIPAFTDVNE